MHRGILGALPLLATAPLLGQGSALYQNLTLLFVGNLLLQLEFNLGLTPRFLGLTCEAFLLSLSLLEASNLLNVSVVDDLGDV